MRTVLVLALSLGICVILARSTAGETPASSTDAAVLERFLHPPGPRLKSYRARRTLVASTMGGRMKAEVEAWTSVDANDTFRFEVIRESGSGLIIDRVLREALETEQRTHNQRDTGQAALTPENYDFQIQGRRDGGLVRIGLRPRRSSPMLLNGAVTVREDGVVVRIDGNLSQAPSWWTERVEISRRYARVSGVQVPVEMSSRADVRVAGDSTFLMTYHYAAVNGTPVAER